MGKNGGNLISVSTREASLKRRLRRHLKALGFHKGDDGTLITSRYRERMPSARSTPPNEMTA
jgi:hypothetical protein